jgi:signal transduction histidine kinase
MLASRLEGGSELQRSARIIDQQANRLSDLISSLRLFAAPPKPKFERLSVHQLLSEAAAGAEARRDPDRQPLEADVRCRGTLPEIRGDRQMLRAALEELLLNAHQAKGRSAIAVEAAVEAGGERLVIRITDTGAGMDATTLHHAMDPFFSAKSAGRRVGMGLPRARQLAQAHGGEVQLRSRAGEGTQASLTIPLEGTAGEVDSPLGA